jgi:hypothetical protein
VTPATPSFDLNLQGTTRACRERIEYGRQIGRQSTHIYKKRASVLLNYSREKFGHHTPGVSGPSSAPR